MAPDKETFWGLMNLHDETIKPQCTVPVDLNVGQPN
jgi:hypothetical protein